MTQYELVARKAVLEQVLEVLTQYTLDDVCEELGEISYLLWKRANRINSILDVELPRYSKALNRLKDS